MKDVVYQGTVWGPWLWNTFFRDAAPVLRKHLFQEIVFADDLNAFKTYGRDTVNTRVYDDLHKVQQKIHRWGDANQVSFDAKKNLSTYYPVFIKIGVLTVAISDYLAYVSILSC